MSARIRPQPPQYLLSEVMLKMAKEFNMGLTVQDYTYSSFWLYWFRALSSKERNTSFRKYNNDPIEVEAKAATWTFVALHAIKSTSKEGGCLPVEAIDANYKQKIGLLLHIVHITSMSNG